MSSKRKRSEVEYSDDEEPSLGRQVLPVANLPDDFVGTPQDGLQYLFTVRRDARKLPRFTRAANPYEIKEETAEVALEVPVLRGSHSVLPSEEWREIFVKRFSNFRQNCLQPTIHIDIPPPARKLTPDKTDRDAWWAYLKGLPESQWNTPRKPKGKKNQRLHQNYDYGTGMRAFQDNLEYDTQQYVDSQRTGTSQEASHITEEREVEQVITIDPAESLPTPSGTPAPDGRSEPMPQTEDITTSKAAQPEPTPTRVRYIDHRYALHLLMYFAHWINLYLEEPLPRTRTFSETHARWMFVLLSRVDEYITADEQSTLRSLARGCIGLIKERMQQSSAEGDASLVSDGDFTAIGIPSCWMVITAVTGIWGQKDLWMDAEAMLSSLAA